MDQTVCSFENSSLFSGREDRADKSANWDPGKGESLKDNFVSQIESLNPNQYCLDLYLFKIKNIQAEAHFSHKVSTDRVEEAKKEQIEVEVEEQTTAAPAAADVNQPNQKVTLTKSLVFW